MTVTVFGSGTLHAFAVNDRPEPAGLGPRLVVSERESGFHADMTASMEAFSAVRELTQSVALKYGIEAGLAESAKLVVSELMGNVVRAAPENESARLIVEVSAALTGIEVIVHDAVPGQPTLRDARLDDADATAGRGLALLDLLAESWTVEPSPYLIKQVRCRLGTAE